MGNSSSAAIDGVSGRVTTLESGVSGLDGRVTAVDVRVSTLESQKLESRLVTLEGLKTNTVSGVDYNIVYAQNSIKAFEPRLASMESRVSTLSVTTTNHEQRLTPLESAFKLMDPRVSAVEKRLTPLESSLGLYDSRISSIQGTLTTQMSRIGVLELSSANFAPRITTLELLQPRVSTLETAVSAAQPRLTALETAIAAAVPRVTATEGSISFLTSRLGTVEALQGNSSNIFRIDTANKQVTLSLATKFCIGDTCITESDLKRFKVERATFLSTPRIGGPTNVGLSFATANGLVVGMPTVGGVSNPGFVFVQPGVYRLTGVFTAFDGRGGDNDEVYYAGLRYSNASTSNVITYLPSWYIRSANAGGFSTKNMTSPYIRTDIVGGDLGKRTVAAVFPSHHYNGGGPYANKFQFTFDVEVLANTVYYFTFDSEGNRANIGLKDTTVLFEPIIFY